MFFKEQVAVKIFFTLFFKIDTYVKSPDTDPNYCKFTWSGSNCIHNTACSISEGSYLSFFSLNIQSWSSIYYFICALFTERTFAPQSALWRPHRAEICMGGFRGRDTYYKTTTPHILPLCQDPVEEACGGLWEGSNPNPLQVISDILVPNSSKPLLNVPVRFNK